MNEATKNLFDYTVALGDDSLMLGQRLSEWCSYAPFLEEDLALANVALDYIGRANMLYEYASRLENGERSADQIAFLRDCRQYRNLLIMELPIGDFAFSLARQFLIDVFNVEFMTRLQSSSDEELSAIAAKSIKESRYHLRRSRDWVIRLGDGSDESHERIQKAFNELWGYTHELFEMTDGEKALLQEGIAVDRSAIRETWDEVVNNVFGEATLERPQDDWSVDGGRDGIHTEYLGHMLSEMQFLQRAYPGLEW